MTAITVFSTAASYLSFASARETNSMPKFEDVAWGSDVAAIPTGTTEDAEHGDAPYIDNEHEYKYDTIVASYLILGFENDHFQGAYVAFPRRSNFDKVTKTFLLRYGEPDKSGSASDNHYWIGNDLNVRLQYQASTDEGILALTYRRCQRNAQVISSRTPPQAWT